jgi:hypothetical protein
VEVRHVLLYERLCIRRVLGKVHRKAHLINGDKNDVGFRGRRMGIRRVSMSSPFGGEGLDFPNY